MTAAERMKEIVESIVRLALVIAEAGGMCPTWTHAERGPLWTA